MNRDTQLQVQAYLDNELSPADARNVSKLISSDVAIRELYNELKDTKDVLVQNEPEVRVPDTRDFYWSQIQRRIATAERQPTLTYERPWWMRFLAPIAGTVALCAVLLSVVNKDGQPTAVTSSLPTFASTPHQLEQPSDVSTITFRSESEGVTVVWITSE